MLGLGLLLLLLSVDLLLSLVAVLGVALEYEATLRREQVSVDLQSPLPEKPDVRLGDMTP